MISLKSLLMNSPSDPAQTPPAHSSQDARQDRGVVADPASEPSKGRMERDDLSSDPFTKSARLIAARALVGVLNKQLQLEQSLAKQDGHAQLSGRDRAFARLIAATTLRRLGQIDGVLKPFLKQLPPALVHNIIRTGVAQMLFLGTPPHAAVGETVEVLKLRANTKGFAGMANAVLRRVSEQGPALAAKIAPQENLPVWLRRSWENAYGRSDMRKMAKQLLADPPLDLSMKPGADAIKEALGGVELPTGTVRLDDIGDVRALPGFDDGAWWVQDIAASLPVKIAGDVAGLKVLDMCAAPGGKTLQLCALGAEVTALDRSESRMARVEENLKRAGLTAKLVIADALEFSPGFESGEDGHADGYDLVLLDAPCSATGTYRRHPDVIYNKGHNDIQSLIKIQDALLQKAKRWVRPGGRLIYCTCSLQPQEGEARADKFLADTPEFSLNLLPKDRLEGLEACIGSTGYFRSRPHLLGALGGMDGFFIACLTRQS